MRRVFNAQRRLDCPSIEEVPLNTKCRDEIIPILRALQHLYSDRQRRQQLLEFVGKDVNRTTSRFQGRRGMDYWPMVVLAAVRLGCNLDYDKLQNLAEEHRTLRRIMGIGDWQETAEKEFDWRRIRDNLAFLRPETLEKLNHLIVAAGHALTPQAVQAVRCDTFVVETNIHYPTESSLIGDGLRKVIPLAATLAKKYGVSGWRQHELLLKNVRGLVQEISRASRSQSKGGPERVQRGYRELLHVAKDLLERARQLQALLATRRAATLADVMLLGQEKALQHYAELTQKVCATARRRVLQGETVPNEEKIFSIFEPETELIKRGKSRTPIQYGHNMLVVEDAAGFICHYEVVAKGVLDQDLVVPVMKKVQKRMGGKIKRASFDRSFHTPQNQADLAEIVRHPCIPQKGAARGRDQHEQASVAFRQARQNHPGVESAIGALQSGNGLERCRDRSYRGYARYVGLGILGRNLHVLGKLLLAREDADCLAAKSRRKQAG
jgi:transposase, IS5 family